MPCGCFGKPKKSEKEAFQKASPGGDLKKDPAITHAVDKQPPPLYRKDPNELNREQAVTTTDSKGEECPLLEVQTLGSSHVESQANDSQAHTPSTIPAASSGESSGASSPSFPRREGASSRAELAEKRREFFSDLLPPSPRTSPSTLPTPGRARHSGKGRSGRPLSQPSSDPGESNDVVTPPGPHLLRPTPASPPHTRECHGFESPEFLLELKTASEEISRRWALPEGELRVREVSGRESFEEKGHEHLSWNGQGEVARSPEASSAQPSYGEGNAVAPSSGRMDFVSGSASKDSDLVDLGFSEELDPAEGGSEVVIDVSSPDACSESSSLLGGEDDADRMMLPEGEVVEASLPPSSRIPETLVTPPSPLSGDASPEPLDPSFGHHRPEEEEELDPSALKEISDLGDESFDLSDEAGPLVERYSDPEEGGRVEEAPLEEGMTQGDQSPHGAPLSAMPIN